MMLGRPALHHGATRHVLLIGRWAVKVPRLTCWRLFLHGLLANMQERKWSCMGYRELCPVIWAVPGGWLSVMPRAEPLTDIEWAVRLDLWHDLYGSGALPIEQKRDSLGRLGRDIVAVDYGT